MCGPEAESGAPSSAGEMGFNDATVPTITVTGRIGLDTGEISSVDWGEVGRAGVAGSIGGAAGGITGAAGGGVGAAIGALESQTDVEELFEIKRDVPVARGFVPISPF